MHNCQHCSHALKSCPVAWQQEKQKHIVGLEWPLSCPSVITSCCQQLFREKERERERETLLFKVISLLTKCENTVSTSSPAQRAERWGKKKKPGAIRKSVLTEQHSERVSASIYRLRWALYKTRTIIQNIRRCWRFQIRCDGEHEQCVLITRAHSDFYESANIKPCIRKIFTLNEHMS